MDRTPDALVHYPAVDIICQLDYQGRFAVDLLCTDDFDLEPNNLVYHVHEQFPGGRNYYIWFPYGPGTEIDIMMLAPPATPVEIPDDGTAITQAQADARYINVEGDIMDGPLTLMLDPQDDRIAAPKKYVDDMIAQYYATIFNEYLRLDGTNVMRADLPMNNWRIVSLADPVDPTDAANKQWTEAQDAALKAYVDAQDTALKTYVDSQDTALRAYVDSQDAAITAYIDAQIASLDAALRGYADSVGLAATEVAISTTAPTDPNYKLWIEVA